MAKKSLKLPKALAGWAYIDKPSTKFDNGCYEILLTWKNPKDVKEAVETAKQLLIEEFGAKKAASAKNPFKLDPETGAMTLKAKSTYKPSTFNAHGVPYDETPRVYGGSIVRAAITLETWTKEGSGIKAYLNSLQILKLVEGTSGVTWDDESDDEDAGDTAVEEDTDEEVAEEEEAEPEPKPVAKKAAAGTKAPPAKRASATDF